MYHCPPEALRPEAAFRHHADRRARAWRRRKQADEEIAAGHYRGPLHGIPWGAKDLLAVKGYPTTWGAGGFEHQSFDEDATVVQAARCGGSRSDRQVHAGRAGHGRQVVWRADAQPVESGAGIERIVGGIGERGGCGLRGVCDGIGDAGIDLVAFDALRLLRVCGRALAWCRAPARWR